MTFNARLTEAEISFHRGIYKPRQVRQGTMPQFWMQRVCWAGASGWGRQAAYAGMQRLESNMPFHLFDHWGTSTDRHGQPAFVAEPYADYENDDLWGWTASVAEVLGLHFMILPAWQSWHFPGNTVRIEFTECRRRPFCRKCFGRQEARDRSRDRRKQSRRSQQPERARFTRPAK